MAGINRASTVVALSEVTNRKARGIKCVFISHQKGDRDIAKRIADYLKAADIDVYFDEDDHDLRLARQTNNPKLVTDSIRKGIEKSSHMLCIITANTANSKWVPFEVGYGYDKTQLGVLLGRDVKKEHIPEYVRAAPLIIPDINSLNGLIAQMVGATKERIIVEGRVKDYNSAYNPLAAYVEPYRTI